MVAAQDQTGYAFGKEHRSFQPDPPVPASPEKPFPYYPKPEFGPVRSAQNDRPTESGTGHVGYGNPDIIKTAVFCYYF